MLKKEELIAAFKTIIGLVDQMNSRQRWELRRNLKEYCRLINRRFPYGKPAEGATKDATV